MPTFDPSDLIGRTFLLPPEENGERHRAKDTRQVVEIIDQDNGQRIENIKFILDIGNGKVEELISYNQLLEHLENACRILGLTALNSLLQYVNWLVWEVCSVN